MGSDVSIPISSVVMNVNFLLDLSPCDFDHDYGEDWEVVVRENTRASNAIGRFIRTTPTVTQIALVFFIQKVSC